MREEEEKRRRRGGGEEEGRKTKIQWQSCVVCCSLLGQQFNISTPHAYLFEVKKMKRIRGKRSGYEGKVTRKEMKWKRDTCSCPSISSWNPRIPLYSTSTTYPQMLLKKERSRGSKKMEKKKKKKRERGGNLPSSIGIGVGGSRTSSCLSPALPTW